ncbi:hypothetical protein BT93_H0122 [Corymbia citriodora subsp. variegata]|nr:hypothetical protein BT93_H0122 [Corymbia citriodora subsp. variegata]
MKCDNGSGDADDEPKDLSEHHINDGVFTSDNTITLVHDKHKLDMIPNTKIRRSSTSFGVGDTCKVIRELIKAKTSQFISGYVILRAIPPPVDPFSIFAVIDILISIHGLKQDLYNKALEQTCVNVAWREVFIKSSAKRRY